MRDVVIVGAGPAGLGAALALGRQRRDVLLCDSGRPRNAPATEMHMFPSRDGIDPAEFRRLVRTELAGYPSVTSRAAEVTGIRSDADGFTVDLRDGSTERSRRILLATGVTDRLPDVTGLADRYGQGVHHCPFCHGWESRDTALAVLGADFPHGMLALYLKDRFTDDVVLCTNGPRALTPDLDAALAERGIAVHEEPVAAIEDKATLRFAAGTTLVRDGIYTRPVIRQHAGLAAQLGCELLPDDSIKIDECQRTTVAGVYAAGDAARVPQLPGPLTFALPGAADGTKAAIWIDQDLFRSAAGVPFPAAR